MVLCACSALARTQRGAFDDALLLRGFARLVRARRGEALMHCECNLLLAKAWIASKAYGSAELSC